MTPEEMKSEIQDERERKLVEYNRKAGFMDGLEHGKLDGELCMKVILLETFANEKGERSVKYLNKELEEINAEEVKSLCIKIENIEKKNLGELTKESGDSIKEFEKAHYDLCYYVATQKPWGQE